MITSVEGFAAPSGIEPGDRVLVHAIVEQGKETLEHANWVRLVEAQFARRGIAVTRSPEDATLWAGIGFILDGGRDVTSTFAVPQWGVTGYSGYNTVGTVNRFGNTATFNSTTSMTPQYGVTGFQTGVRTTRVFRRAVALIINRRTADDVSQPVFQARGTSEGGCGMLSAVAPVMIEALFSTFPAGGSGRVTSEVPGTC